ncbi:helix-turn-helix domain-containing protein [Phenylobacterium sp.]|uniref:Crp/Fnr family transcriptional regulator n=1 Tax=Phenylobacterium sp. TaxID=1871053 RepID=UPI002811BB62|nr:helix-turn-helix domain-containing protein [Phenylobacterium sp.]
MISALRPVIAPVELLLRRFSIDQQLRPDDVAHFGQPTAEAHSHPPASEISRPGVGVPGLRLVASGIVAEARTLRDGRRQITALRLPGDLFGAEWSPQHCDVIALTAATTMGASALHVALRDPSPRFDAWRLAWTMAQNEEEKRRADHMVRLGRLTAYERVGHLLLELRERLARVGLAGAGSFHLPLTQETFADMLGLSVVHVNRTLQQLRRDGLVNYRPGHVALPDPEQLASVCAYGSRSGAATSSARQHCATLAAGPR